MTALTAGAWLRSDAVLDATVVLIDGRSGAGKTTLAARLVTAFRARGRAPQTLRVEDLYPGWDGLAAGSAQLGEVLQRGWYQPYNWHLGATDETVVQLPAQAPLIIEGCGAVTDRNLAAAAAWAHRVSAAGRDAQERSTAVVSAWCELPTELRRARALARDGATYEPHWQRWASQEDVHFAVHRPWMLVDTVMGH